MSRKVGLKVIVTFLILILSTFFSFKGNAYEIDENKFIYISSNGDNENSGLEKDDPVLTMTKAIELVKTSHQDYSISVLNTITIDSDEIWEGSFTNSSGEVHNINVICNTGTNVIPQAFIVNGSLAINNMNIYGNKDNCEINRIFNVRGTLSFNSGTLQDFAMQGIYCADRSTVNINGGSISSTNMNAIHAGGATVKMNGGTISGISVSNYNTNIGAIYLSDSTFEMTAGTIIPNKGNGIYACVNSTIKMTGGTIAGNSNVSRHGIHSIDSSIEISNGEIKNINSDLLGSALYLENSNMKLLGGSICANKTTNNGTIYAKRSTIDLISGKIEDNSAQKGGALYIDLESTLSFEGTNINKNKAVEYGGGIYAAAGKITLSSGKISENTAVNGGGLYVEESAELNMVGGVISSNTATKFGGGIFFNNVTTTLFSGKIEKNKSLSGAGIYVRNKKVELIAVDFSQNKSSDKGGAIYAEASNIIVNGGVFTENEAAYGGVVYSTKGSSVVVNNGTFTSNIVTNNGGAFYVYTGTDAKSSIVINKANVQNNKYKNGSTYTANDVYIAGEFIINSSDVNISGNIYVANDYYLTVGGDISNNVYNLNPISDVPGTVVVKSTNPLLFEASEYLSSFNYDKQGKILGRYNGDIIITTAQYVDSENGDDLKDGLTDDNAIKTLPTNLAEYTTYILMNKVEITEDMNIVGARGANISRFNGSTTNLAYNYELFSILGDYDLSLSGQMSILGNNGKNYVDSTIINSVNGSVILADNIDFLYGNIVMNKPSKIVVNSNFESSKVINLVLNDFIVNDLVVEGTADNQLFEVIGDFTLLYNGSTGLIYQIEMITNYYVSSTGDDDNNGLSETTPFLSLSKALEVAGTSKANIIVLSTLIIDHDVEYSFNKNITLSVSSATNLFIVQDATLTLSGYLNLLNGRILLMDNSQINCIDSSDNYLISSTAITIDVNSAEQDYYYVTNVVSSNMFILGNATNGQYKLTTNYNNGLYNYSLVLAYPNVFYLDYENGNDLNDGTLLSPVKSLAKVYTMAKSTGAIVYFMSTYRIDYVENITVAGNYFNDGTTIINLLTGKNIIIKRYSEFKGTYFIVSGTLTIQNMTLDDCELTGLSPALKINQTNSKIVLDSVNILNGTYNSDIIFNSGTLSLVNSNITCYNATNAITNAKNLILAGGNFISKSIFLNYNTYINLTGVEENVFNVTVSTYVSGSLVVDTTTLNEKAINYLKNFKLNSNEYGLLDDEYGIYISSYPLPINLYFNDTNGVSISKEYIRIFIGTTTLLDLPTVGQLKGYVFNGWTLQDKSTMLIDNTGNLLNVSGYVEDGRWICQSDVNVYVSWKKQEYDVSKTLQYTNYVGPLKVEYKTKLQFKLISSNGYSLPNEIELIVESKELVLGNDYTYDKKTGNVVVFAAAIVNDIKIVCYSNINKYLVEFLNYNGSLIYEEYYEYGKIASFNTEYNFALIKEGNQQYSYVFIGWDKEFVAISGNISYTACYSSIVNKYEIKWYNGAEVILTTNLDYGTLVSYGGIEPTRESTIEFSYSFAGWYIDPDFSTLLSPNTVLTEDVNYYAKFNATRNKYSISWYNEEELIYSEIIEYGQIPLFSRDTPTKESTAEFSYVFKGWSPLVSIVTKNESYFACYESIKNKYNVSWYNGTTLLLTERLDYGSIPNYEGTPFKVKTPQYSYVFKGWSPEIVAVTEDVEYNALFDERINQYYVKWFNDDVLLKTDIINYGETPEYTGNIPTKDSTSEFSYKFSGWTPNIVEVIENQIYYANFEPTIRNYKITWKNGEDILKEEVYAYGSTPSYIGATPTKEQTIEKVFVFDTWTPNVEKVTKDVVYTAVFAEKTRKYNVTFDTNYDYGKVSKMSINVDYGSLINILNDTIEIGGEIIKATPLTPNEQYTYHFECFDESVTEIKEDILIMVNFSRSINKYNVKWINGSTVLETDVVEYGKLPVYNSNVPVKLASEEYTYEFIGWTPAISMVVGDVTYKAEFKEIKILKYANVHIQSSNVSYGNVSLSHINVLLGSEVTVKENLLIFGDVVVYASVNDNDEEFNYEFVGFENVTSIINGDITIVAVFEAHKQHYTVTWKNDETVLETDNAPYNSIPTYDGSEPEKAETDTIKYVFDGWDKELTLVESDVVYNAIFKEVYKQVSSASYEGFVTIPEGFDANTTLNIKEVSRKESEAFVSIPEGLGYISSYSFLLYVDGMRTDFSSTYTVKIQKTDDMKESQYIVLMQQNGEIIEIEASVEDDYLVFNTNCSGYFIVVDKEFNLYPFLIIVGVILGLEIIGLIVMGSLVSKYKKIVDEKILLNETYCSILPLFILTIFDKNLLAIIVMLGIALIIFGVLLIINIHKFSSLIKQNKNLNNYEGSQISDADFFVDDGQNTEPVILNRRFAPADVLLDKSFEDEMLELSDEEREIYEKKYIEMLKNELEFQRALGEERRNFEERILNTEYIAKIDDTEEETPSAESFMSSLTDVLDTEDEKSSILYRYSFTAKLIMANEQVKLDYIDLINTAKQYGVKYSVSWKQVRIYKGNQTYALILFRKNTLCVAFNLIYKNYIETEYKFTDLSKYKRFEHTPCLLMISSRNKFRQCLDLISKVLESGKNVKSQQKVPSVVIPTKTKDELIYERLIKLYSPDVFEENYDELYIDLSRVSKLKISSTEVPGILTDEQALENLEVVNTSNARYEKKAIVTLDTISKNFTAGSIVTLELLKKKKIVNPKTDYVRILARGSIDKPLIIEAQDFTTDAIKMLILTGGQAHKVA